MQPSRDIDTLLAVMTRLRDPETGCPWDIRQTFASIAPYTQEEAAEVVDAIARGDLDDLKDELGDLLLQVVYHAEMAREIGAFDFGGVVEGICAKMIRRHPHVFGNAQGASEAEVSARWETIKAQEKQARGRAENEGLLAGIPAALPALLLSLKLQKKAATVGFDWNNVTDVIAKIREELDEVEAVTPGDQRAAEEEVGDLLFAVVNLARHRRVDPHMALRRANEKFTRRFGFIERALVADGRTLDEASLEEMEALWQAAKAGEK